MIQQVIQPCSISVVFYLQHVIQPCLISLPVVCYLQRQLTSNTNLTTT
jgi:hypothetical protein